MAGIIDSYIPVVVFAAFAVIMPTFSMMMVKMLSPRSKAKNKYTTYESGSIPTGQGQVQFNVEYYQYAIIFVLFDVEILFLYPWAVVYKNPGLMQIAIIEMLLFMVVVLVGYVYAWKKGALSWVR